MTWTNEGLYFIIAFIFSFVIVRHRRPICRLAFTKEKDGDSHEGYSRHQSR